jgi:hypothetical protein
MMQAVPSDPRIPVVIGSLSERRAGDALLIEGDLEVPPGFGVARWRAGPRHAIGCACCLPRGPVAEALAALFVARARSTVPFFTRVLAVPRDEDGAVALRAALESDVLVRARFRAA